MDMETKAGNMLWLFCLISLYVNISSSLTDGQIPLLKLIELHTDHCNTPSFCTFRSEKNRPRLQNTTCCQPCSCEKECTGQGTCCPDYDLTDVIGTKVSSNISHLSKRLKNINFTSETRKYFECIEVRESHYERTNRKKTYEMVSSCLSHDDQDMLMKCEQPRNISTFQPDLFIPVTSKFSMMTYRNKYCLFCSQEGDRSADIDIWDTFIYCRARRHVNFNMVTPLDLMKTFLHPDFLQPDIGTQKCHIEFFSRLISLKMLQEKKCDKLDFETCPDGSDKELDEICRSFHLPVSYPVNKAKVQRYNNIACFLCRTDKPFMPACKLDTTEEFEYGIVLNVPVNSNKDSMPTTKTEESAPLKVTTYGCSKGFIKIISSDGKPECARVLCPLNFYPFDGECYPAFNRVYRVYYRALFDVRRSQKFGQKLLNDIRTKYMENVLKSASKYFLAVTWGIWEKDNTHDLLMVSFSMPFHTYTYMKMISRFGAFLDSICIYSFITDTMATQISSSLNRNPNITLGRSPTSLSKAKQIRSYKELNSSLTMIELFNTHLCYRVAVPVSEKKYYTNNMLVEDSIQYTQSGQMKVCLDDVYRNITDINAAYMFGSFCARATKEFMENIPNVQGSDEVNDNDGSSSKSNNRMNRNTGSLSKKSDDDVISDSVKTLLVVGLLSAVVVVVVASAIMRKRKQTTEDTEETNEEPG